MKGTKDQASAVPAWPNMHEALMELHHLLDEWWTLAGATRSSAATLRHRRALVREGRRRYFTEDEYRDLMRNSGLQMSSKPDWLGSFQKDVDDLMAPPAPLMQRWSGTRRRQAARRTLRSMMRIYCPDVLAVVETAMEERGTWIIEHRAAFKQAFEDEKTDDEITEMIREMHRTEHALRDASKELAALIREKFPLGEEPGPGVR
ncbi:hypothetical protein [Streptomyces sp. NPDC054866]